MENWHNWIFPLAVCLFFGWRFFKFRRVKGELPALLRAGAKLVDVRSVSEFEAGHNPLSVNIPLGELEAHVRGWPKDTVIVLCCASGTRSGMALALLRKCGFRTVLNAGPWINTIS